MERRKERAGSHIYHLRPFVTRLLAPYRLYLIVVSALGLRFALQGLSELSPTLPYVNFILLLSLAIVVQLTATSISVNKNSGITYTIAPAVILAIVPSYGVAAAALAEAVSAFALWLTKPANERTWKKSLPQLAFNIGIGSIAIYVAGSVFLYARSLLGPGTIAGVTLPWVLAAVVNDQVNLWLLIGILSLQHDNGPNPVAIWRENLWAMPIGVLSMSIGGAVLAFAVAELDWVGVLIFFLPILLSSYADYVYVRQMQEHMDHLEEIVAERTKESAELMREKDAFLAVLTHDMKSPLTTIGLYADMIKKQPGLVEKRPEFSDVILRSQRALTEIVDNILDVERLQSGQDIPMQWETFELGPLLEWLAESMGPQAQRKEIVFQLHVSTSPIVVTADRQYLERIFTNLFSNAIKYTPPGGEVCVTAWQEENDALIDIKDTGYGIPREDLPHIFEPFRRVSKHKDKAHGSGLGLAIAKALINAHGGEISVNSLEEEGSTFNVRLPICG